MLCVAPLAPEHIPAVAAGYRAQWPEYYGPQGAADAAADLAERARGEGLPLGLVALQDGVPVGAVALAAQSVQSHAHLTPWLIGLWTAPSHRREGVATRLTTATLALAAERGAPRLFVATHGGGSLFHRPVWRLHEALDHDGERLTVFVADL